MKTNRIISLLICVILVISMFLFAGCVRTDKETYGLNETATISLGDSGNYEITLSNIRDSRNAVYIDCTYNNTSKDDINLEYQGFVAYNKNNDRLQEFNVEEITEVVKAGETKTITLAFESNLTKKKIRLEYYADLESDYSSDATFVIIKK